MCITATRGHLVKGFSFSRLSLRIFLRPVSYYQHQSSRLRRTVRDVRVFTARFGTFQNFKASSSSFSSSSSIASLFFSFTNSITTAIGRDPKANTQTQGPFTKHPPVCPYDWRGKVFLLSLLNRFFMFQEGLSSSVRPSMANCQKHTRSLFMRGSKCSQSTYIYVAVPCLMRQTSWISIFWLSFQQDRTWKSVMDH